MVVLTALLFFCHLVVIYCRRVLITGGAGFIGFHTGLKLAEDTGNEIVVLDIFDDSYDVDLKKARAAVLKEAGVIVHSGDVCSRQMLDHLFEKHDFTAVVHMAGKHGAAKSMDDPISFITANTECLLRLLDTLKRHKSVHLVYASSHSVYGVQSELPISVRSNIGPPTSVFAALKMGTEEFVEAYCNKHKIRGIGLRLFNVYGPWGRPDGDIYRMAQDINDGKTVKIYTNKDSAVASRDYTFVSDVVNGVILAMNRQPEKCGEIYNIGSGAKPVSMKTVFSYLKEEMGKNSEMTYTDIPVSEPFIIHGNIALTTGVLGYHPKVDIREGIKQFVIWFKEYHEEEKWSKSPELNHSLKDDLDKKRIDYANKKFHDRLAEMRMKYQDYAEKNKIPVTKYYRPKKFLSFPGKKPKNKPQRQYKEKKKYEELETLCQQIDECVGFTSDGGMYSHVHEENQWEASSGTTLYLVDMDVCQAGFTTCYGNCTCTSTGPSQFKNGCDKGFGLVNVKERDFCIELYSPDKPTAKEEEFKLLDKMEGRDWYSFIKNKEYVRFPNTYVPYGTIAYYPDAAGDVTRLQTACDNTHHCLGFTTNGELKGMIMQKWWDSSSHNFYVRDVDYCSIGIKDCPCKRQKPGKYGCTR